MIINRWLAPLLAQDESNRCLAAALAFRAVLLFRVLVTVGCYLVEMKELGLLDESTVCVEARGFQVWPCS